MVLADETKILCQGLSDQFNNISSERVWGEIEGMLKADLPSFGMKVLRDTKWISHFPEWASLIGVLQDKEWHPEGDAWVHTLLVQDAVARHCHSRNIVGERRLVLGMSASLHDTGKLETTVVQSDGRVTARGHEDVSADKAMAFMVRMGVPFRFVKAVCSLVS